MITNILNNIFIKHRNTLPFILPLPSRCPLTSDYSPLPYQLGRYNYCQNIKIKFNERFLAYLTFMSDSSTGLQQVHQKIQELTTSGAGTSISINRILKEVGGKEETTLLHLEDLVTLNYISYRGTNKEEITLTENGMLTHS